MTISRVKRCASALFLLLLACLSTSCWWSADDPPLALRLRISRPRDAGIPTRRGSPPFSSFDCFFVNIASPESPAYPFQLIPAQTTQECPRLSAVSALASAAQATGDGIPMRVHAGRKRLIQIFAAVPAGGGAGCGGAKRIEDLYAGGATPQVYLVGGKEQSIFRDEVVHVENKYTTAGVDLGKACQLAAGDTGNTGGTTLLPPASVTFSQTSWSLTIGNSYTIGPPVVTGGAPESFSLVPASPPGGMTFDQTTGTLQGKPTLTMPMSYFTIVATNAKGSASTKIGIGITAGSTASFFPVPDGPVRAMAMMNGLLYLGGDFQHFGPRRGHAALVSSADAAAIASDFAPFVDGPIYAAIPDGGTGFFIGGDFQNVGTTPWPYLARIKSDGTLDTSFTAMPNGIVRALALDGSGLFLGGDFTKVNTTQTRNRLALVSASSGLVSGAFIDPKIDDGSVYAITFDSNIVYAGGTFTSVNASTQTGLSAFTKSTGSATGWCAGPLGATGGSVPVRALAYNGTDILVGGDFTSVAGSTSIPYLALLSTSCSLQSTYNPQMGGPVHALLLSGAYLYVGGTFTQVASDTGAAYLARMSWSAPATLTSWAPGLDGAVEAIANGTTSGNFFIGGRFSQASGQARERAALVDVFNTKYPWSQTFNGPVLAIATSSTKMMVGGEFSSFSMPSHPNLAAIDMLSKTVLPWDPQVDQRVHALASDGTSVLYAGGDFSSVGGSTRQRLAAFDNGGNLTSWAPAADNTVKTLLLTGGGSSAEILFGGTFTHVLGGGAGIPKPQRFASSATVAGDLGTWQPAPTYSLGAGEVRSLGFWSSSGTGYVYMGGAFDAVSGNSAYQYLARTLYSTGSVDSGFAPSLNGATRAIAIDPSSGNVYIGGDFSLIGAVTPRNRLAGFTSSGSVLGWDPGTGASLTRIDSVVFDSATSSFWIGGLFNTIGAISALPNLNLSRIAQDGSASAAVVPKPDGEVFTTLLAGGSLFVGGAFDSIGPAAKRIWPHGFGVIDASTGLPY